jgi:HD superfamily phosphohydrolase
MAEFKKVDKSFRDPVLGYVNINYELLINIVDTFVFQRLRRIKQLSGVCMVFHSAEHSRFSHSLGVYELMNRVLNKSFFADYTEREKLVGLVSALLHDIGHGAFSHSFEKVFDSDHEYIGTQIILKDKELRTILDSVDSKFAEDVASVIAKKHKFPVLENLLSSQMDVDRIDYLLRDAYFAGVTYGTIDVERIFKVLKLKDNMIVYKESGIHAIENYLISRYHMYSQIYYHPISRCFGAMLNGLLTRVADLFKEGYKFNAEVSVLTRYQEFHKLEDYLLMDDYYLFSLMNQFMVSDDEVLKNISSDILKRRIWNRVILTKENEVELNEIKNKIPKKFQKYYVQVADVTQNTYSDVIASASPILILTNNGKVVDINSYSKFIQGLVENANIKNTMMFYKNIF